MAKEDPGYLVPGVTLEMKLEAVKAFNRTSGRCSPVSLVDAVAAAIDAMPKYAFDIGIAMTIWEWLKGQGLVRPEIEYTAESLGTLLSQYVTISMNDADVVFRPTVMKIREILERGDWLTKGNSENVVDAVQRVCEAKKPGPPDAFRRKVNALGERVRNMLIDWHFVESGSDPSDAGDKVYELVRQALAAPVDSTYEPPAPVAMPATDGDPRDSKAVHHPAHYGGEENPYEVIKVLESWLSYDEFVGAMKFNIHKYLARGPHKGVEQQDYEKGMWYTARLVDYIKRNTK